MARPIIAVSSVVVGCLAFVVAARLTVRYDAPPPPPAPARDSPAQPRSVPRPPALASGPEPRHIQLPPQVITVRRRRARVPVKRRAPDPQDHGWPCSPWRALGPVYSVHAGEKPRQRHVRSLCFGTRPAAGG